MKIKLAVVVAVALTLSPLLALAQSARSFNPRTPETMARGNFGVGAGGDYTSLFYNPAGLTGVDDLEIQAIGPLLETNKDTFGFIKDASGATTPSAFAGLIGSNAGKPMFMRSDSISYVTMKQVGFGLAAALVYDSTVEQAIKSLPTPLLATRKTTDVGVVLGASYDVIDKWLSAGANLKAFERWSVSDSEDAAGLVAAGGLDATTVTPFGGCGAMAASGNCVESKDFAVGADIGGQFMIPFEELVPGGDVIPGVAGSRIQVGAVWQDVGDTRFHAGDPYDIRQSVDTGIAWIQSFGVGNVKLGADFRDLNRDQVPISKKTSVGGEIEFKELLTLRVGLNNTGGAAGLALRLWMIRLQGGWYQERSEFQQAVLGTADVKRDNRFFVQLGAGWYN